MYLNLWKGEGHGIGYGPLSSRGNVVICTTVHRGQTHFTSDLSQTQT